jgi:hypothetical protein
MVFADTNLKVLSIGWKSPDSDTMNTALCKVPVILHAATEMY